MKYYKFRLKLVGKYDKRIKTKPVDYQIMLIADDGIISEAFVKNEAGKLFSPLLVETIIEAREISKDEYLRLARLGEQA